MYFARGLLSPDGSMRSEQDRKVNLCILQHVPRRYQKISPLHGAVFSFLFHEKPLDTAKFIRYNNRTMAV